MTKGILQIFFEKIQEVFGGEKISSELPSSKINSPASSIAAYPPKATSSTVVEIPTKSISLVEQLHTKIAQDSAYIYVFEAGETTTIPAGMVCSSHVDKNGNVGCVTLANGNPKANSGGPTGGYSVRLPDHVEAAASGHHVTVHVIARASGSDRSHFAVAYSTNEVGNSGWRKFTAGPEWSIHTMEYDVPVMKDGRGDFVGILPDSEGNPGTEFCYFAINISEKK
ncbi:MULTISPECIES: hypothetical protein [Nitrosomonas]|uniref:Uncharacterized protein n=1 Tax=Nitrosomonas communis TaxID=44574 RepID=A0A0F7KD08_9PROT|nr:MULTISPECIES: hypothetical protein [Nitrosomonas]AKH37028.1 hypothetical protein AAW31_03125 [Nitrosomonas communis]TYP93253.1 hypothetical protein BCL69_100363 [Nitrosomonas communis]UVS62171.1 hypothetical protein NX761_03290 [Nitrosomonas sp. PLL12]